MARAFGPSPRGFDSVPPQLSEHGPGHPQREEIVTLRALTPEVVGFPVAPLLGWFGVLRAPPPFGT